MSMLAGPKRKQKWILTPRGTQWSQDSNKFGQKMLEKMGWSTGKGLGAQEQGTVEHIRVRVKNDQVGIGYIKDCDNQWSENQDEFNSFLQDLQKEQSLNNEVVEHKDNELTGKSLEEKSKQSQKRVHYKKFIRGKDVNKYSPKDLANIFGKKDLNEKYVKSEEKDIKEENEDVYEPIGAKDTINGIVTIKGGNMNDYFKNKSMNFVEKNFSSQNSLGIETEKYIGFDSSTKSKSKFYINNGTTTPVNDDSDSENERYSGFGLSTTKKFNNLNYVFDNPCLDLNVLDDNSPISKKVKTDAKDVNDFKMLSPKKRKKESSYDNEEISEESTNKLKLKKIKTEFIYENEALDLGFPDKSTPSRKNKFKDNTGNEYEEIGCLEVLDKITPIKSKKINTESISNEYENHDLNTEFSKNLTPKNIKQDENESYQLSNGYDNLGLDLQFSEKSKLKKSKKTKNKQLSEENKIDILDAESLENLTPEIIKLNSSTPSLKGFDNFGFNLKYSDKSEPQQIKRDKNEVISTAYENLGLDLQSPNTSLSNKNKKSAESENLSSAHENPGFDLDASYELSKRRKIEENSENLSCVYESSALNLERVKKPTPVKPKRRKKNNIVSTGLKNPGLDLEMTETSTPTKDIQDKEINIMSNVFINPALDLNSCATEAYNNTADFEVSRASCGLENNALDLSDENSNKKRVTFNDQVEYSSDIVKKKKKKKKLDKYEVKNEKLKKLNKVIEPVAFINEGLDVQIINNEEIDNQLNERKSKKCKRKKERRISLLETIEEIPEEENLSQTTKIETETVEKNENEVELVSKILPENEIENIQEILNESLAKKKHKKRNKKTLTEDSIGSTTHKLEEIDITDDKIEIIDISEESTKIIKKKKKKNEAMEAIELDSGIDDLEKENVNSDKEEKKKKKRKTISSEENKISLEEFLNESVQETKADLEKINETCMPDQKESLANHELRYTKEQYKAYYKEKTSKQRIKSFFKKNPILMFPGSNINEIPGYGCY